MADSADLVVLGAYFGTGAYGGMMSVFLMGSYDPDEEKWKARSRNALMRPRFTSFAHRLCFVCLSSVCGVRNRADGVQGRQRVRRRGTEAAAEAAPPTHETNSQELRQGALLARYQQVRTTVGAISMNYHWRYGGILMSCRITDSTCPISL